MFLLTFFSITTSLLEIAELPEIIHGPTIRLSSGVHKITAGRSDSFSLKVKTKKRLKIRFDNKQFNIEVVTKQICSYTIPFETQREFLYAAAFIYTRPAYLFQLRGPPAVIA